MKLIFLYGPPAAGKLTVARELCAGTGYRLFHNHLTVDLAASLFDYGSAPYLRYVRSLRLQALEVAAREQLAGMVFTFVYTPALSDPFIEQVIEVVRRNAAELCFVHLFCRQEQLEQRVRAPERSAYRKLTSIDALRRVVSNERPAVSIAAVESLSIDNSDLSPQQVAQQIIQHYSLGQIGPIEA